MVADEWQKSPQIAGFFAMWIDSWNRDKQISRASRCLAQALGIGSCADDVADGKHIAASPLR